MLKRKKNVEIDLIELSKDEILENEKKIWGYSPEWRKRDVAADQDFIAKKNQEEETDSVIELKPEDKIVEAKVEKLDIKNIEDNLKDYSEAILEDDDAEDEASEELADNLYDEIKIKKNKKKDKDNVSKNNKLGIGKILARVSVSILTAILIIVLALLGLVLIIEHGPSKAARNLFVNSVLETSAGKFLATTFVSADVIEEIKSQNSIELTDEVTDSSLINVAAENVDITTTGTTDDDGIELIEINGGSYNGYLMKIKDPSRVMVGTCGSFGGYGLHVDAIVDRYGAIAGVNGGGFEDENGMGNGGTPIGLVISNGELLAGELNKTYDIAGFDSNNVLVVGSMTGQQALDRGIRDCCCYGPTLIVNGVATTVYGTGSGINPRTAIGQCADGTVLLLVIDGRQINSIGATFADVIDVMLEYGAVNAYNLDGGSSTALYYNGEYVNSTAPLTGSRLIPTAIIVK